MLKLRPVRIGLWDRYGGSSASGWTRWMLERYEFPFEVVYAKDLDAGNLANRFDVLIFTTDALPVDGRHAARLTSDDSVPPEYRRMTGSISWTRTLPQLKQFVESGGTVLTIGQSSEIAERLGVPIENGLVAKGVDGSVRDLTSQDFYIPGSILRVSVDNTTPLGYGFEHDVDVFFDNSPSFRLSTAAGAPRARRVAWYDSPAPLRSGWAWGQRYLDGTVAVVDSRIGKGHVLVFGPEINYRAQPHGTFKFLFNGIYRGVAKPVAAEQGGGGRARKGEGLSQAAGSSR
jgi:hypothetical protein